MRSEFASSNSRSFSNLFSGEVDFDRSSIEQKVLEYRELLISDVSLEKLSKKSFPEKLDFNWFVIGQQGFEFNELQFRDHRPEEPPRNRFRKKSVFIGSWPTNRSSVIFTINTKGKPQKH